MKTSRCILLIFLLAAFGLASASAPAVAAQPLPALQGGATRLSRALPLTGPASTTASIDAASVRRVSTLEVLPYLPFASSTSHITEVYNGAMGSLFTFDVGSFGVQSVSNLAYTANPGVTCSHDANLLITCSGSISQVTIEFDFTYVVTDYIGNTIWWGYNGQSNYDLEYTFHLIYPAPLVYLQPYSLAPVSVTANEITWYLASTKSLVGAALFRDPRVQVNYLPRVSKLKP